MEVTIKNSFWDYLQFNLYVMLHSVFLLIILAPALFIWGDLVLDVWRKSEAPDLLRAILLGIFFIGGLGVFFLFFLIVLLIAVFFTYKGRNSKLEEGKLQVSESGLVTEASVGRSELQWSAVKAIKQNKRFIFIFFSSSMACLVPKRAFAQEADANKFFIYMNELWEKSKH